ncbi:hypothetical protein ACHHYP_04427 [Achlya hypogyna]|uniref:Uncharacterized protein n=1 Tax=Achlya hypogyna TaxID=1202772 RepID=A0A1V9ZP83_ACHHY|nr:hypothetical protein ACHHYP_04427 [Achlya hypogyna]
MPSTAHASQLCDDGATDSDGSARPRAALPKRAPGPLVMRAGPFTDEEVAYIEQVAMDFREGLLDDVMDGTHLRSYLSNLVHCQPMRLSKRFVQSTHVLGLCMYNHKTYNDTTDKAARAAKRAALRKAFEASVAQQKAYVPVHKTKRKAARRTLKSRKRKTRRYSDSESSETDAKWRAKVRRRTIASASSRTSQEALHLVAFAKSLILQDNTKRQRTRPQIFDPTPRDAVRTCTRQVLPGAKASVSVDRLPLAMGMTRAELEPVQQQPTEETPAKEAADAVPRAHSRVKKTCRARKTRKAVEAIPVANTPQTEAGQVHPSPVTSREARHRARSSKTKQRSESAKKRSGAESGDSDYIEADKSYVEYRWEFSLRERKARAKLAALALDDASDSLPEDTPEVSNKPEDAPYINDCSLVLPVNDNDDDDDEGYATVDYSSDTEMPPAFAEFAGDDYVALETIDMDSFDGMDLPHHPFDKVHWGKVAVDVASPLLDILHDFISDGDLLDLDAPAAAHPWVT